MALIYPLSISIARQMSPCDIPLRVRIFLMLSPSLLLINIIIAYEILHFQTILYYNSSVEEAKQNQKFPFHFLSAPPTPPAEENKKGKENFWFLLPRPQGADEARRLVRLLFEKGSSKVYDYNTHKEKTRQIAGFWFLCATRNKRQLDRNHDLNCHQKCSKN